MITIRSEVPFFVSNMKMSRNKLFSCVLAFLLPMAIFSQRGVEIGGLIGVSNYFGDLNTDFRITEPGPAASFLARYNLNNRLSFSGLLSYAYIYAKDENSENDFEQARNLSFGSHLGVIGGRMEFNFLPYTHGSYDEAFTPYILVGFSGFYFNPRAKLNDTWYSLKSLTTEGQDNEYFSFSGAFVLGGGMKFDLTREWSINIELVHHRVFTDYLDDVSGTYPNLTSLRSRKGDIAADLSDPSIATDQFTNIGEEGRQRGNSKDGDSFNLIQVGLVYYFSKVRCPAISNNYD